MPLLVTLQWSRLAVPAETPAARCPPCLNGLTSSAMPQWLHLCRRASMVTHLPAMPQWSHICPLCLNGLTSARPASMVTHLPAVLQWLHICPPYLNGHTIAAMPQWSHTCRRASMVTHLPPCLNGLTIPSTPHALTNCPATPPAPRKPPFCGLAAPLGTCSAPFVSCHPASREARWWPSCADKMCVAVRHSH